MDQNYCRFCHEPCGERSFCDEVCYEEYESQQGLLDILGEYEETADE